ncbi:uroporphyrinogen decarboxylase family protein [uncultured Oscillibacter sp.]|uniref:uroporphyrinogen decarboxylase family protein n=1 Tax=uncultured Oscillibacter sp. TaxID=876091 RepID=UPI0025FD04DB|nr:uroporphyrinogen decarboxylase family protein [uncultured Oscillibacter sp.]
MSPKELLFAALSHKPTPRPAWVPFAGAHAAKLLGYTATEFLQSEDKMVECLLEVHRMFKPDGECCIFDLQVEAEILGCDLVWADNGPPSVSSHPLACDEDDEPIVPCECTIPGPGDGRIPKICSAMRRIKAAVGDTTALYGLITGPFTLASHLRGSDIFMDMFDNDTYVHDLLHYCNQVACKMADYYIDAGMDVIAVVDPLISQISTAAFEEFMTEPFSALFAHIKERGAFASFFVCGDATRNVEAMCQTGCDAISVDENVNLKAAKAICDRHGVSIGGNIPLTTTMLHGTQQDNMKWVVELLDSIEDKTGLVVAPGCDMPFDIPFENTIGCAQAVFQTDAVREMVKDYVAVDDTMDVDLPDYAHLDRPLVEAFTLDPATCAACTYMVAAADEAKAAFGDRIHYKVYKYTVKEDIARTKKMGVPNLPSLYINGQLAFQSIIPSKEELDAAILKHL